MKLTEIQSTLQEVIQIANQAVLVDDGAQDVVMEDALKDNGLAILIMLPQAIGTERTRGAVAVDYSTTVWVRTNPKVQQNDRPKFNPLALEDHVISQVMEWSKRRSDFGFRLTPDLGPETDWADIGNNSRLIRFTTTVHFIRT